MIRFIVSSTIHVHLTSLLLITPVQASHTFHTIIFLLLLLQLELAHFEANIRTRTDNCSPGYQFRSYGVLCLVGRCGLAFRSNPTKY